MYACKTLFFFLIPQCICIIIQSLIAVYLLLPQKTFPSPPFHAQNHDSSYKRRVILHFALLSLLNVCHINYLLQTLQINIEHRVINFLSIALVIVLERAGTSIRHFYSRILPEQEPILQGTLDKRYIVHITHFSIYSILIVVYFKCRNDLTKQLCISSGDTGKEMHYSMKLL